jgi:Bacterial PH domain
MQTVFRSRIDGRFGWIALVTPAVALLALLGAPAGSRLLWIPLSMVCLAAVLVCWIFLATSYELRSAQLVARCGPFAWRIPYDRITDVRESASLRSGPALSLDRLEIVHDGGQVLIISPADKARFVTALRRRIGNGPQNP